MTSTTPGPEPDDQHRRENPVWDVLRGRDRENPLWGELRDAEQRHTSRAGHRADENPPPAPAVEPAEDEHGPGRSGLYVANEGQPTRPLRTNPMREVFDTIRGEN